jgi:chromosome segregation ATPase
MNYKNYSIILVLLLTISSLPAYAGKIYRFKDKNGVSTLSKVLPPYAAQQGYDILDDKSFRIIERVMTLEESSKINAEEARIAKIKEEEDQLKLERLINDRSLLDRYPDDRVMIKARDADLAFIQKQITDVKDHQEANQNKLHNLQQNAAEAELAGQTVSAGLEKNLAAARNEIENDQLHIKRLQAEYTLTAAQYDIDLARLRELLNIPDPVEKDIVSVKDTASEPEAK